MVGQKIKELRQQKGWSQEELGQKIQYTKSNVSKWENETTSPDIETLKKLAELFEVDINYFLGIETPKQVQTIAAPQPVIYLPREHVIEPEDQRRLNKKLLIQLLVSIGTFVGFILMILAIVGAVWYGEKVDDIIYGRDTNVDKKHLYESLHIVYMVLAIVLAISFVSIYVFGIINASIINKITRRSTVLIVFAVLQLYFGHIIVALVQFLILRRK